MGHGSSVLLITSSTERSPSEEQVIVGAGFYGLDVQHFLAQDKKDNLQCLYAPNWKVITAIVITAEALPFVESKEVLLDGLKGNYRDVPVLITGVTPEIEANNLSDASKGYVVGSKTIVDCSSDALCKISDERAITKQLAGQELPCKAIRKHYLIVGDKKNADVVMEFKTEGTDERFPVFVKVNIDGRAVFFQAEMKVSENYARSTSRYHRNRFFEIAGPLMFLRYACGERCWHSVGHYANLTIDDPWLTEPYGNLSYKGLLKEMEKANFHTTIAFIPWNYNRSQAEVVSLFRSNPERFSISIHGNNHDHYEFYKYRTEPGDRWPAKPLNVQEANVRQALGRMEQFKRLTGIDYDRVMVFPHGIAPAKTLRVLKEYNFLATVNAGNTPLLAGKPPDSTDHLRQVTLEFENFPSLNRWTPGKARIDVLIDLFLGNPILFYAHQEFFGSDIGAFNEIADMVNESEPEVQWKSLGDIARHLYLKRLREDGNYDVLAFAGDLILENKHSREVTYFIEKPESFSPSIRYVTVDDELSPYDRAENKLILRVTVSAKQSRRVLIEYKNQLFADSVDVSKSNMRVGVLRWLSDFRDMHVSTNRLGRAFGSFYYQSGLFKRGL